MGKVYLSDVGTTIDLDVSEDITDGTVFEIVYLKPDGTTAAAWTASLQGESVIRYTTAVGNIDQTGVWSLQAKVTTPDGVWYGETVKLRVYAAFT